MYRQLIQGMYEDRSSPRMKVVKRNSEVIRNRENVLEPRPAAILNPQAQKLRRISGHHIDPIPAFTVESDSGET